MDILAHYINGNVSVSLYSDGTKERTYEGIPTPVHPESIDVKITDYCDAGCSYCHEKSTTLGQHADLAALAATLAPLPAGVELALGGGNPLSHPGLLPFLECLKSQGIVVNMTINQKHLKQYKELILKLIHDDLIKGVGISYSASFYIPDIIPILQATDNVVFHVIMGINKVEVVEELHKLCSSEGKTCKILVLGYKNYGFGLNYYLKNKSIEANKYHWYTHLAKYFDADDLVLSFDNLAISQLNLSRYFTKEAWNKFYMGDDFVFTQYIDGVKQQYAPSSTSDDRVSFSDCSLLEYFQNNRNSISVYR